MAKAKNEPVPQQDDPQPSVVRRIRVAGGGHVSEIGVALGGFGTYDVDLLSDGSWRFASDDEASAAEEPEEPASAPAAPDAPEAPAAEEPGPEA